MADTLRVLIVEDVPTDAELMEYELQKPGWSFRHAQKMEAIPTLAGGIARDVAVIG